MISSTIELGYPDRDNTMDKDSTGKQAMDALPISPLSFSKCVLVTFVVTR